MDNFYPIPEFRGIGQIKGVPDGADSGPNSDTCWGFFGPFSS